VSETVGTPRGEVPVDPAGDEPSVEAAAGQGSVETPGSRASGEPERAVPAPHDAELLIAELEQTAARLRAGALDVEEATALVERCADLATRLGAELDRQARPDSPDQETLL
jgi:hypothetical protein